MGQGESLGKDDNFRFSLGRSLIRAQVEFEWILGKGLNSTLLSEFQNMKNGHGHSPTQVFDFW